MSDNTPSCVRCGRDNDNGTHSALELTEHLSHAYEPWRPAVIDAAHLARQRDFSERTFGPGRRTQGILNHIHKELKEIEADPTDVKEWVDVVILALDGAWRSGWESQEIIDAIRAKQERNEAREWPDWRTADPDKAIEHVRYDREDPDDPDLREES